MPGSPAASVSCALPIPASMAPGTYQLRLFRDDGYTKRRTSNTFTVTSGTLAAARGSVLVITP